MFFGRVYEFSFDFGWISGKRDEINKFGQFRGPTAQRKDPMQQRRSTPRCGMSTSWCGREGGLDKPWVCQGEGLRRSVAVLRHSVALFTDMCFCHVLLFCYSEDLSIRLMRTL